MTSQGDVEINISGDIEIPEEFNAKEKTRCTDTNDSTPAVTEKTQDMETLKNESSEECTDPNDSTPVVTEKTQDMETPKNESSEDLLMQLPANLQLTSPDAREWVQKRRENVRPWLVFCATSKFKAPSTIPRWTKRVMKNIEYFQSNYVFVFLGLIIYCLITSPLLLIAIAASLGACTYLSRRNTEKKIVIGGNEVSLVQQYSAVAVLSIPLFYIAGAGSILFWVLGASFFLIAIHATMYNIESVLGSDDEPFDLQMEQV